MLVHSTELPETPLPVQPRPKQPSPSQATTPMVYVYENPAWEYNVVTREPGRALLSVQELNTLGEAGWEMVGIVALSDAVNFYFKRQK